MGDPVTNTIGLGAAAGNPAARGFANDLFGMFRGPSTPGMPDFYGAAEATAAGNLRNARAAQRSSMVNQDTPWASLRYSQTGTDEQGNPIYSASQTYNPQVQALISGLMGMANQDMQSGGGIDQSQLPSYGINPGQSYQDAMMAQLQPQLTKQRESLDQQLANQGIPIGSEAWNAAKAQQGQQENQLLNNAITSGMGVGLQANQQAYQQALQNKMLPIQRMSGLLGLAQSFNPGYVNAPGQQAVAGPDVMGATNMANQFNMNMYNQQMAQHNAMMGGLFGLGAAGMGRMSDIRTKENIQKVGQLNNGLNVYEFDYKPEFKDIAGHGRFMGVMAHEVEQVIPEAVMTHPTGYKMVNYALIA